MPRNRWTGAIALINEPTVDGRTIELLHVDDLPLPIVGRPDARDAFGRPIGTIEWVRLPYTDGRGPVTAEGFVDLEPGQYEIGIDVGDVVTTKRGTHRGVLKGATVIGPLDAEHRQGAWADAVITVTVPAGATASLGAA